MTGLLDLWSWVSPWNTYQTIADVVTAAKSVRLDGFRSGVLLPVIYGNTYQAYCDRTLCRELAPRDPDEATTIRREIEAQGIPCGGWGVPTADGDIARQGREHGLAAARFDFWMINFEHGWPSFWTPDGYALMTLWIGGFWGGVEDGGGTERLNGHVGVTMVANTAMMHALDDNEMRAWVEGTNLDALEAYLPGDPGLDPGAAIATWRARLAALSIADRHVVVILKQGDLPALVQRYADPVYGAQIWTLTNAAAYEWPPEDPCAEIDAARHALLAAMDTIGTDLLTPVARLKLSAQPKAVQSLVTGIRAECARLGISHA